VAPRVYVIVINWNGEDDTISCLQALLDVDYDDMHVVISDNGSRPESLQAMRDWAVQNGLRLSPRAEAPRENSHASIRSLCLIENGKNLGFTGANTAGIAYALQNNAAYVLFLNNDAIATRPFLRRMVDVAERNPDLGVLGCKTFYARAEPATGMHRIWSLGGYDYVCGNPMNRGRNQRDQPGWTGVVENELICGCCMLIRRAVIDDIGVQDDDLFFAIDDVEYSLRAARAGWRNALVLDAAIYHEGSASMAGRTGLQLYYLFRNTYYFRTKYFPWYHNIIFFAHHLTRYFVIGGAAKALRGAGHANRGMVWGIGDFLAGRMGECSHHSLLNSR
jgi:GT2 family glycosyltransferase